LRTRSLRHSFQDANYHDQIVKEQNKPTPQHRSEATPARGLSWTEVRLGTGAQTHIDAEAGLNPRAGRDEIATSHPAGTEPENLGSAAGLKKN
jgi:hypothetical protein